MMPEGHDADRLRAIILEKFDMSLGTGLGKLAGKAFRIGHLGDINDLTLVGALSGVEMGLKLAGVPTIPAGRRRRWIICGRLQEARHESNRAGATTGGREETWAGCSRPRMWCSACCA